MALTSNEEGLAARLLDEYAEVASNAGCNDLEMDNTDESWALVERAGAWGTNQTVESWRKSYDARERPDQPHKIIATDWLIAKYLAACMRGEA